MAIVNFCTYYYAEFVFTLLGMLLIVMFPLLVIRSQLYT